MNEHVTEMLSLLQAMNAANNQNWDVQWRIYHLLLFRWPDELGREVVTHAALNCKWRPSPAELREIAAKMESPVPAVDAAMEEVLTLMRRHGAYAAPHPDFPDRPGIRTLGEPPFSHPLIASAVRRLGGWVGLCEGDTQYQSGGLQGSFRDVYNRSSSEWHEKVMECLDNGTRPAALFPPYTPFQVGDLENVSRELQGKKQPPNALPPRPAPLVPMPADIRQRIVDLEETKAMKLPPAPIENAESFEERRQRLRDMVETDEAERHAATMVDSAFPDGRAL